MLTLSLTIQKLPYPIQHLFGGVLEDVVSRVVEPVDLRVRTAPHPLREEVLVEDEVLHAPTDHHGGIGKSYEPFGDLGHEIVSTVPRP